MTQEWIQLFASERVMRCKLVLHAVEDSTVYGGKNPDGSKLLTKSSTVRFGAVWEGSTEAQKKSENAIFGDATPMAEFKATIRNPDVIARLKPGVAYYVDFIEVPEEK